MSPPVTPSGDRHPRYNTDKGIKPSKTVAVKIGTNNDRDHAAVKITLGAEGNNDPENRYIPKSQRRKVYLVAHGKNLYRKGKL